MSGEEVLACGGLAWIDDSVAEIKRMWVDPAARGHGLATRLLAFLEQIAAASGRPTVRLDTNPVLTAAIAMYRKNGYRDIGRYNDNPYAGLWFEKHIG
jgi:ribosomal protein S18 acetylase RimI-like enzyme